MAVRLALALVVALTGCTAAHDAEIDGAAAPDAALDAYARRIDGGADAGRDGGVDVGNDGGLDGGADAPLDAPPGPDAFLELDGFVPGPPRDALRPVAPLSGAYVSTRTPTLRWHLPDGADGASIELCADRACTVLLDTESTDGESVVVSAPLPPGVVFWRVRARTGGVLGAPSATWELVVPHTSAAIESSWGLLRDLDGDGFADILAGAPQRGTVTGLELFRGGPSGLQPFLYVPLGTLALGWGSAAYGDLNGDGFVDVVLDGPLSLIVVMSTELGPSAGPTVTLPATAGATWSGRAVAPGDLDGDGYGDLVFLTESVTGDHGVGHVQVHLGGPNGPAPTPVLEIALPSPLFVDPVNDGVSTAYVPERIALAAVGDVTGDGVPDVLVGTQAGCPVYAGSVGGLDPTPVIVLPIHGTNGGFARDSTVVGLGDVTGDGRTDVAIVSSAQGFELHFGTPTGLHAMVDGVVAAAAGSVFEIAWLAPTGDLDGDGVGDVFVMESSDGTSTRLHAHLGSATGPLASAVYTAFPYPPPGGFDVPGDVDGDALADLVMFGANSVGRDPPRLSLLTGHATAPILRPGNDVPLR